MTNLAPLPIHDFLKYGTSGVTFFFVLSGFVLTWSAQPGTKVFIFYRRRFARIWPAHIVALVPAMFVFYRFDPPENMWWIKPFSIRSSSYRCSCCRAGRTTRPSSTAATRPPGRCRWRRSSTRTSRSSGGPRSELKLDRWPHPVRVGDRHRRRLTSWRLFHSRARLPVLPQPVLHSVAFLFGIGLAIMLRTGWKPCIPFRFAFAVFSRRPLTLTTPACTRPSVPVATTMGAYPEGNPHASCTAC